MAKSRPITGLRSSGKFKMCDNSTSDAPRQIYDELAAGRPVGAAFHALVDANGNANWSYVHYATVTFPDFKCPADGSEPPYKGGHAVCIVGFEPDPNGASGGHFIFKNSFGGGYPAVKIPGWGPGYGRISSYDVQRFCWELMFLTKDFV